jgi:hypothetical protein
MQMRRSSQWLATPANALNCCRKGTQRNSRRGLAGALSPAFRLAVATVVVAIFRCFLTSKDARPAAQAQCKILSAPDLARTREWFDAAGAAINSRHAALNAETDPALCVGRTSPCASILGPHLGHLVRQSINAVS